MSHANSSGPLSIAQYVAQTPIQYDRQQAPLYFSIPFDDVEQGIRTTCGMLGAMEFLRLKRKNTEKFKPPASDAFLCNGMTIGEYAMSYITKRHTYQSEERKQAQKKTSVISA